MATTQILTASGPIAAQVYVLGPGRVESPASLDLTSAPIPAPTVRELLASRKTFTIAHRGGSRDWAEFSPQSYAQSASAGYVAMEVSVGISGRDDGTPGGGTPFLIHDTTLNRTSGLAATPALKVREMTWAAISAYQNKPPATAATGATAQPYMRLADYLDAHGPNRVHFLDLKYLYPAERQAVIADLVARGLRDRVIGKVVYGDPASYDSITAVTAEWSAAGFATCGLMYEANRADFAQLVPAHDVVGIEYTATQDAWDALKAVSGAKRLMGHICPNAAAATTAKAKGASAFMVASPATVPPTAGGTY